MSVIKVKDGKWDCTVEAESAGCTVEEWTGMICRVKHCSVCGEDIWKGDFIFWRDAQDIAFCRDCAEHTLNGLSRDLAELKGDKQAIHKTGEAYSPIRLKAEKDRLQGKILEYLQRIVELQNLLASTNER